MAPGVTNHNGRPLQELGTLKNFQSFIEFPFIWLYLKFVERKKKKIFL
jgi:hypothetical protein